VNIGERIYTLRKKAGLSQEQLAEILGTTRQAVSKWEAGKSLPDLEAVIKLGAHFQVSMDHLLLGKAEATTMQSAVESKPAGGYRYLWIVLTIVGLVLLILLPVFASSYCVLMKNLGPVYADPMEYLNEWPLAAVKWTALGAILSGLIGIVWVFRPQKCRK
jgi:transcriptional regulator with XRE-family HTH domain